MVGYHGEKIREYFGDGSRWSVTVQYSTQKSNWVRQTQCARCPRGPETGSFWSMAMWCWVETILSSDEMRQRRDRLSPRRMSADSASSKCGDLCHPHTREDTESPSNMVNTGLYLLTRDIFDAIDDTRLSRRGEYELTDSLQLLIDRGIPLTGHTVGNWLNFTYPWDLLSANQSLMTTAQSSDIKGEVEQGAVIKGPVSVGKGSVVRSGSYIIGPVAIGEGCDIGPNCYIRPCTAIGDGCHIGASVE